MATSNSPLPDDFDVRYREAGELGKRLAQVEPRAKTVRFDRTSRRFYLLLTNGVGLEFDAAILPELQGATEDQLAEAEVMGTGGGLGWDSLDAHISVPGLVMSLFGGKEFQQAMRTVLNQAIARKTSEAKAAAARANGAKGGRPRKIKPGEFASASPDQ